MSADRIQHSRLMGHNLGILEADNAPTQSLHILLPEMIFQVTLIAVVDAAVEFDDQH